MELITVALFPNPTAAHLRRTLLEAEGIEAFVANEHMANTLLPLETALGGVHLQVRAEDAEDARRILENADDESLDDENMDDESLDDESVDDENAEELEEG